MKERKLTLLIALSIILTLIMGIFFTPMASHQEPIASHTDAVETSTSKIVSSISDPVPSIVEPASQVEETSSAPVKKVEKKSKAKSKPPIKKSSTKPKSKPIKKTGKYPEATIVWKGLKAAGLNDHVSAGIMGNIMAEIGGQSLDFSRWSEYSRNGYYGICQWSNGRKSKLLNKFGPELEDQVTFLVYELLSEMDTYGYKYQKGFGYEEFMALEDCEEAALAFAKCFERCGSGSYSVREENAVKAYNYFVG